jgi:hypothetical protein
VSINVALSEYLNVSLYTLMVFQIISM